MTGLLIVEDEHLIREELKAMLKDNFGSKLVFLGEAANGEQGLEMLAALKPDLVITDLRMPRMGGIQMIKQAQSRGLCPRFIIISGYAEFDYAQSAISLGARAYLLKILKEDEVVSVVGRQLEEIEAEKEAARLHSRDEARQAASALQDTILLGEEHGESLVSYMREPWVQLAVLQDYGEARIRLPRLRERLGHYGLCVQNAMRGNELWILLAGSSELVCRERIDFLLQETKGESGIVLGAGPPRRNGRLLRAAYYEALDALTGRFLEPQVFYTVSGAGASLEEGSLGQLQLAAAMLNELSAQFSTRLLETLAEMLVQSFTERVRAVRRHREAQLQLSRISAVLLQASQNQSLSESSTATCLEMMSGEILHKIADAEHLSAVLGEYIQSLMAAGPDSGDVQTIVMKIKRLMEDNYHKNFQLETFSEMFHLDIKHLSKQFKRYAGQSFVEYLTRVRMERAKMLLTDTDFSVQKIAFFVGYNDYPYFHRVFKTNFGLTPAEFRNTKTEPE